MKHSWSSLALVLSVVTVACSESPVAPSAATVLRQAGTSSVLSGRVTTLDGRPIGGARVARNEVAPILAVSDDAGMFRVTDVVAGSAAAFFFAADGYEPRYASLARDVPNVVPMVPSVEPRPGEPVRLVLTTADLSFYVGEPYDSDYCRPCVRMRTAALAGRGLRLRASWEGTQVVGLWASEGATYRTATADGPNTLMVEIGNADHAYLGVPLRATPLAAPLAITVEVR